MKTVLSIILCAALVLTLCGTLAGCGNDADKPLRILIDFYAYEEVEADLREALTKNGYTGEIEFDYLTWDDLVERDSKVTRVRTEIMAGKGPDVFLLANTYSNGVFLMTEKNMGLGQFLSLDKYLDKAQFMQIDRMNPTVLAAGHDEKYGQVVMPIAYGLPVNVYLEEEVQHQPSKDLTWQDILDDDTGILQVSGAAFFHNMYALPDIFQGVLHLAEALGPLADYQTKKLLFTEDELYQRLMEILALEEKYRNGEYADVPQHFNAPSIGGSFMGNNTDINEDRIEEFVNSSVIDQQELSFVPVYSDDGGVSATINCFAAISANTKRPEEAFFVLDTIMSYGFVRTCRPLHSGCLIYDELLGGNAKVVDDKQSTALTKGTFERFCDLREQITYVTFSSSLNAELEQMAHNAADIYFGYKAGDEEDIRKLVKDAYRAMRMSMDE